MKKIVVLVTIFSLALILNGCFFNKSTKTANTDGTASVEKVSEDEPSDSTNTAKENDNDAKADVTAEISADVSGKVESSEANTDSGNTSGDDAPSELRDGTINYDSNTSPAGGEMGLSPQDEAPTVATRGNYLDYNQEQFASLKGTQPVALFFHASWCEICTSLDTEIRNNIADIPSGTTILKVDYDTELELRKSLEVYAQATIVIFDKRGVMMNKLVAPAFEKIRTELISAKL